MQVADDQVLIEYSRGSFLLASVRKTFYFLKMEKSCLLLSTASPSLPSSSLSLPSSSLSLPSSSSSLASIYFPRWALGFSSQAYHPTPSVTPISVRGLPFPHLFRPPSSHLWLLSVSLTPHLIHQDILWVLLWKCIHNVSISLPRQSLPSPGHCRLSPGWP